MQFELIDNNGGNPVIYDSILLPPSKMGIFNSDLALKIIEELVKEPACAMDLARRLDQHEQKIYYHLRRLEAAGVVKHIRSEKRYSMTAKIFGVVSPVVSTRLFDGGHKINRPMPKVNAAMEKFFHPFIQDGKLNARVIAGDPYPHGKYDKPARDPVRAFDVMVMLGSMLKEISYPIHQLDVDTGADDLKENLILIGSPKTNTIVDRMNVDMPITFDPKGWTVKSAKTGKSYDDGRVGIIIKADSPFAKGKKILMIAGVRTRGTQAAVLALTQNFNMVIKGMDENGNVMRIVEGHDTSGNKIIDSVKFLE
jgi:DNA-binding transcriptional ArsR family regulator